MVELEVLGTGSGLIMDVAGSLRMCLPALLVVGRQVLAGIAEPRPAEPAR